MNLIEARKLLTRGVLHVGGTSYAPDKIDSALQFMGNDFVNATGCTRTSGTVAITADTNTVDIAAALTTFTRECFGQARIATTPYLNHVNYADLLENIFECPQTGTPKQIAFEIGSTEALLYPTPVEDTTLTVLYAPPFTSWKAGTTSPTDIELNIPDRYIQNMVWLGAAAALVDAEADTYYHSAGWKQYERLKAQTKQEFNRNPGSGRIASRASTL